MIERRLKSALENVRYGSLFLTDPDGNCEYYEGAEPGPHADLYIEDWKVIANLAFKGDVGFADAHRKGLWESTDLEELFRFALRNEDTISSFLKGNPLSRMIEQLGYFRRMNSVRGSRRNIYEHYDLGNAFYRLWLDPSMTYSSGLFRQKGETLENAQLNKYDRILDRIDNSSGSILEIGCGWGGFAERALERCPRPITGLTVSDAQKKYATYRLKNGADIQLKDYRHVRGLYDYIVSIEMFEAVGMAYWKQYFQQVKNLLKRGGKALVQSIVISDDRFESYRKGSDVIRSYIFPGGMLPSNEKFCESASQVGLRVQDQFGFGKDYATTLRLWLRRFDKALPEVKSMGFDDSFIRLWRYYLASCAAGFEEGRINVIQYELQHAR
jgi:cyclopropane-fatty-acyl-phospholipid synthase